MKSGTQCFSSVAHLGTSAAPVGGLLGIGQVGAHESAAAPVTYRDIFFSPWIWISQQAIYERAEGFSHSPSSKASTVLVTQRRRFSVSTSSLAFLKAKLLMDTGTKLELGCTMVNHLTEAQFAPLPPSPSHELHSHEPQQVDKRQQRFGSLSWS